MQYSQRDFFNAVLSSEGRPCLAKLTKGKKRFFKHEVFTSIDSLCDSLDTEDFTTADYYFCISTLAADKDADGRVRTQKNALMSRVFVLDIDIRPEKEGYYSDIAQAREGVAAICAAMRLPKPIVVNSGFGLHVYWPMVEGVESARWKSAAERFKKAIQVIAPEVVADGSRVADSAGVLRIPDSFNLKGDPLAPVKIEQWFSDFLDIGELESFLDRTVRPSPTAATPNLPTKKVNTGIAATSIDAPSDLARVAKNCNWVGTYIRNRTKSSEPEWYAILGLVPYMVYTKDGEDVSGPKLANLVSKGHADYDADATHKKYMQARNAQTGPTTCAHFQSIDPKRCEGCPFAATVKSPIHTSDLSKPATNAVTKQTISQDDEGKKKQESVTIPLPPKPYFRGEDGGVFVRTKKQAEDGTWEETIERIYDFDIYPVRRYRTEALENELMEMHLWLPKDGLRKFKLPNGLLADNKSLAKFVSEKGVVTEFGKTPRLVKFLVDYVRHLQMTKAAETEFSRFGWREIYSADPKFVVGDGYIDKIGSLVDSSHADFLKTASKAVSTKGDLAKWREGFNVYVGVPDSEPYQLAALLGFAAPLMALTEYAGVLYNMNGHSGAGKSTALKVMTSVFGEPNDTHITKEDTEISTFNFIGYLNNVPVAYDELTNLDGMRLSNFCLNFTTGRGKMRADRTGQNRSNETQWDTIVCSTSNTSLYDKLAEARKGYNAEAMRVFELPVARSMESFKDHVDKHVALLKDNYGIAGREYIEYLLPRIIPIRDAVNKAMKLVDKRGKLRTEERFWGALMACVLVGGKISKDILKLHDYDVEGLVNWALGTSDNIRKQVEATTSDPLSNLAEFFNANLNAILRVENGRAKLSGMQNSMNSIKARIEYKENIPAIAYISVPAMREYCRHRNIDHAWMRRELGEVGIITGSTIQRRLTSGTELPSVNVKCWRVDMRHPDLNDLIEIPEDTESAVAPE